MKPRNIIAVVALLAVVLLVAGVTAADGPRGVAANTLPLPIQAAYNGYGPDGNIAALLIVQQNPVRGPASPAIYGTADANDGGWFVSIRGNGIFSQGNNTGIWAQGTGFGGYFQNLGAGPGVYSQSSYGQGVYARQDSAVRRSTPAVQGLANVEDGGWFSSAASNGVVAQGPNAGAILTGGNQGAFVQSTNGGAPGMVVNGNGDGLQVRGGYDGIDTRTNSGDSDRSALYAKNEGAGYGIDVTSSNRSAITAEGQTDGVVATARGDGGNGVVGIAKKGDNPYAIWGQGDGQWAGYFSGDVRVTGSIDQSLAAVKMDDPRAPTERYLNQATVVGGEMLTMYNGNVTTDAKGVAVVKVPAYVEAINKDFRYQLTTIGQFAQAIVEKELKDGEFVVRTDKPFVKVSWQVSGVRNDPAAQSFGWKAEEDKSAKDKGTYLNPAAYGQSKSMSVDAARIDALNKRLEALDAARAAKDAAAKSAAPVVVPDISQESKLPALTAKPDVSRSLASPSLQKPDAIP